MYKDTGEKLSPDSKINNFFWWRKVIPDAIKGTGADKWEKGKLRQKQLARDHSEHSCDVTSLEMHPKCCSSGKNCQSKATMDHRITMRCKGEIPPMGQIPRAKLKVQLLVFWGRP